MAGLTGTFPGNTYGSLLRVDQNTGVDGTLRNITDGLGNETNLQISTGGLLIKGTNFLGIGANSQAIKTDATGNLEITTTSNTDIEITTGTGKTLFNDPVEMDGNIVLDGIISTNNANIRVSSLADFSNGIQTDEISESSADTGILADGVLLKDNDVEADEARVDTISEKTLNNGILIDGTLIKDGKMFINTIGSLSGGLVAIDDNTELDGTLSVSGVLSSSGITNTGAITSTTTITATGNLITSGSVQTDSIIEKTATAGITIDSVLLKDDSVQCSDGYFDTLNDNGAGFIQVNDPLKVDNITKVGSNVSIESVIFNSGAVSGVTTLTTSGQANLASTASQADVTVDTSDPVAAPTKEGDIWINTTTPRFYIAVGTSAVGDWKTVTTT